MCVNDDTTVYNIWCPPNEPTIKCYDPDAGLTRCSKIDGQCAWVQTQKLQDCLTEAQSSNSTQTPTKSSTADGNQASSAHAILSSAADGNLSAQAQVSYPVANFESNVFADTASQSSAVVTTAAISIIASNVIFAVFMLSTI